MSTVIKVQKNLKEILIFLEEKGYRWSSGDLPTAGVNWESKLIIVSGKTLTHRTAHTYEPNAITFEQFRNQIDMKTSNILPGYTITLENGNSFVVMQYREDKIVFPEGSSRSIHMLEDFCNEDLSPIPGVSKIMTIRNANGVIMWERKFKRSDIKPGYVLKNDVGTEYLVVQDIFEGLRIVPIGQYTIGALLTDIMKEDMSPATSDHAEIVEVKDSKCKVVYSK